MDSMPAVPRARPLAQRPWFAIPLILLVFLALDNLQPLLSQSDAYRQFYDQLPNDLRRGARIALQIALCVAFVRLVWTSSVPVAARELGFNGRVIDGVVFGFGASLPMFAGFVLSSPITDSPAPMQWLFLAGLYPLLEEVLYRGFLCGLLLSRGRMPAWAAIGVSAALFGWVHVDLAAPFQESIGLFFLTGSGGVVFAWLFLRWRRNIWVPFMLHAGMNLAWNVFNVADSALGGWYPFSLQSASIVLAVGLTLRWTKPIEPPIPDRGWPRDGVIAGRYHAERDATESQRQN